MIILTVFFTWTAIDLGANHHRPQLSCLPICQPEHIACVNIAKSNRLSQIQLYTCEFVVFSYSCAEYLQYGR